MLLKLLLKKRKKLPWQIQLPLAGLATASIDQKLTKEFDRVETFCTFIGYSRSGHSLVAALLDAHPNIVMAHELRAVKYVEAGMKRDALYYLLYQMTKVRGHSWKRGSGYTYDVPNQSQGAFKKIRVIGDKHGEFTVCALAENPDLLAKLQEVVQVPIKFIHVVRNPFDNIATFAVKRAGYHNRSEVKNADIEKSIDRYFDVCESVMEVKAMVDSVDVLDFCHEDFIKKPKEKLGELCLWLGVEPSSNYLEDCEKVVFESPRKSRHKIEWNEDLKQKVQTKIQLFPFLETYTFEN